MNRQLSQVSARYSVQRPPTAPRPPVKCATGAKAVIEKSDTFDPNDISHLSGAELRRVLVERARALQPLLEKNATQSETDRRLAEENLTAIRAAGLLKIAVPHRFGGLETDMRTMLEVSRELAKGCGSTAWVTALNNSASRIVGTGRVEVQQDIWGQGPDVLICGTFAPLAKTRTVSGGLIVNGRWPYASGCLHADWALVGVPLASDSGKKNGQFFALLPVQALSIEDTWHSVGMKGSGSNTLVAKELFVPDHRLISTARLLASDPETPYKDEVLYRSSFVPSAIVALVGPALGMAAWALEYVKEGAALKGVPFTVYETQKSAPGFQMSLAKASMLVDTAQLHAYRAADAIDESARQGQPLSYLERARTRMDAAYAAESAGKAMDLLMSSHGASSFSEHNPLQRAWRDTATAIRHAVLSLEFNAQIYGNALLGSTEGISALV